jgi:formamidopyrimidine-DNA glycosylase
MPELPEVETTRRGIEPHVLGLRISRVIVHDPRLRWPIRADLPEWLANRRIEAVERRSKYLLLRFENDERLLIHLGMSGSLRLVELGTPKRGHDHVELEFENGTVLRYHDPRRFGALLTDHTATPHVRLQGLGPEPLAAEFSAEYLYTQLGGRKTPIKPLLMNAAIVVGVGNIYANEAGFWAHIHPMRPANSLSFAEVARLVAAIKDVLTRAIEQGGTTLRDFVRQDGAPGYFKQTLAVYGRADAPCRVCGAPIVRQVQAQRATYFCPVCQPI